MFLSGSGDLKIVQNLKISSELKIVDANNEQHRVVNCYEDVLWCVSLNENSCTNMLAAHILLFSSSNV